MANETRTAQEQLTPEERRGLLRAFADRMLLKVSAMDDPEDMPGVEKAVGVAAVIERIYYRCDRSEHHTPDPHKVEADRARHAGEAIQAKVNLAGTLEWGDKRSKALGTWWHAAEETVAEPVKPAPQIILPVTPEKPAPVEAAIPAPQTGKTPPAPPAPQTAAERWDAYCPAPVLPDENGIYDYTEAIDKARAVLGLPPATDKEEDEEDFAYFFKPR